MYVFLLTLVTICAIIFLVIKMCENNNDIEVVVDDNGESLDISPVYEHLNVAKPKPKEDKKDIIIPEVKKKK